MYTQNKVLLAAVLLVRTFLLIILIFWFDGCFLLNDWQKYRVWIRSHIILINIKMFHVYFKLSIFPSIVLGRITIPDKHNNKASLISILDFGIKGTFAILFVCFFYSFPLMFQFSICCDSECLVIFESHVCFLNNTDEKDKTLL